MEVARSIVTGETSHIIFHPRLAERFEYDIQVMNNHDIPELELAKILSVKIQDDGNTIEFKEKKSTDPAIFVIPLKNILMTTTVTAQTKQMIFKRDNLLVQIDFTKSTNSSISSPLTENIQSGTSSIRLDMAKGHIRILIDQINQFRDEKINPSIGIAVAVAKDSKLCIQCAKKKYILRYRHDYNLCLECFTNNYGKVILEAPNAEYHGGHKAYLGGGAFDKYEPGRLILSERFVIFARENNDPTKRWEIIIPLDSVIAERWGVEEISRRKGLSGGGVSFDDVGIGIGTGMIHDSGKAHHIVIPYIDENGIPQEPRFGVSSFRGKAIREWAAKLYQQVVNVKRGSGKISSELDNNGKQSQGPDPVPAASNIEDPIKVLKMRFAKGEITKEQYEEMRKMLE